MKRLEISNSEYVVLSKYAKKLLMHWFITLCTIVILSLIVGVLKETIIIFFVFASIRKFAGGYHMKKFIYCLVSSTVMVVGGAIIAKHFSYYDNSLLYIFLLIESSTIFLVIKPIATKNTQTSEVELLRYRIIIKAELLLVLTIIIALNYTNYRFMISSLCIGLAECSIVFLIGKMTIINAFNHAKKN